MQIGARHDDVDRAIEAVSQILERPSSRLRQLRLVSAVAAVVATVAFWGGDLVDGTVQAVAGLLTLGFALLPALALTLLVRWLGGTVGGLRSMSEGLRTWTDGAAREERIAELRRNAAEVRAAPNLLRQVLLGLGLVRRLRATSGAVGSLRTFSASSLASGYIWMTALGIGLFGTALVCWVAFGLVVLRVTGAIG